VNKPLVIAGAGVAAVLFLAALLWSTFFGRPPTSPELQPAEVSSFANLPEAEQAAALTALADQFSSTGSNFQLFVVQANPVGAPIVAVNSQDDDGDEEATHWPVPWPAVIDTLKQPVSAPVTVHGTYAGSSLRHRLIPLDETGLRCLLINSTAERQGWLGIRGGLALVATMIGMAIWAASRPK
jgi:hypothetical protein